MLHTAEALLRKRSLKEYLNPVSFKSLTKEGKRMAIALDVIKSILSKQYKPKSGDYIIEMDLIEISDSIGTRDVREILNTGKVKNCRCCELGACFLSLVRFEDKANLHDLNNFSYEEQDYMQDDSKDRRRLANIFGHKQLAMMESAFEKQMMQSEYSKVNITPAIMKTLRQFTKRLGVRDRQLAININIVQNDGIFKPEIPVKLHKDDIKP
jgi:hypothetical protein